MTSRAHSCGYVAIIVMLYTSQKYAMYVWSGTWLEVRPRPLKVYPLLLEAGWLPGGASLITCMKSGGFMQRGTKRGGAEGGEVQLHCP